MIFFKYMLSAHEAEKSSPQLFDVDADNMFTANNSGPVAP